MLRFTSIDFQLNERNAAPHHRDTEEAQRNKFKPLCKLRALCATVVNASFHTRK
jgi:hypothetical protein